MTAEMSLEGAAFGMYDHFVPGMQAGSYSLRVESRMRSANGADTFHHEVREIDFVVDAPRFALVAQEEIRSCSPPHGGNADYRRIVPHLVLERRAFPWERPIDSQSTTDADRTIPWIALLVLKNEEIVTHGCRLLEMRAGDLVQSNGPAMGPALELMGDEVEETISVLEMSAGLFRAVCPRIDELRSLTHVRRVSMMEKPGDPSAKERDFAILMANRLVQPGPNVVFLVSMEGWRPWLAKKSPDSETSRVRVIVLHSWNFVCDTGDGSFAATIKSLHVAPHADQNSAQACKDPALQSLIARGYTPIAYQPDGTAKTVAWYRGPLAPTHDAAFSTDRPPFESSDAALIFDECTGIVDISLSAAFQLGRLLALSSPNFCGALRHWNQMKEADALTRPQNTAQRSSLVEEMAQYVASHALGADNSDHVFDDVQVVSDWLVQLRRLQSVPIRYLVPAANLLPPESLRLFYVDENWLDALTDGALSLGTSSSSSQWFMQTDRGSLRQTLRTLTMNTSRYRGISPTEQTSSMTGFLLRSSLFETFPGVEIECLGSTSNTLPVIRMEMLDRGLLLLLVEGIPGTFRFKLPRESLTFSHDERGLRPRVTRTGAENLGERDARTEPIMLDDYVRRDAQVEGVLDVRKLHEKLEGTSDTSGARFALHWLNGPDDVTIQWDHAGLGGLA